MNSTLDVDIAVIGAGVVGIATAYYLCRKYQCRSVVLIDARDPMSYTSAQSGDNYRNWWPSQLMTDFTDHSIALMHDIARESSNSLQMKQSGYALATRRDDIDDLLASLQKNYANPEQQLRVHTDAGCKAYVDPLNKDWASNIEGVDIVANKQLIREVFPEFSPDIENVLHIRKAGDFSSQQMGQFMLEKIRPLGCKRLRGQVLNVSKDNKYQIEVQTADGVVVFQAVQMVNAAGPYVAGIAGMLGIKLSVQNIFQQKITFQDQLGAVPRDQPFSIDIDQTTLEWSDEERSALSEDSELAWLTKPIDGGIHCRPEGEGKWIKLGWAYNRQTSEPDFSKQLIEDPQFDSSFPEIVLRGAARLNPALSAYIDQLPPGRVHYGGYYTMTKENWPLIGPLDGTGAFVVGALSGFGSMAACAAGSLCADWVCGGDLPDYARAFSPARYNDTELLEEISNITDIGLL